MNDAFTVRHLESIDELQADLGDPLVGQGATQVDEFFQGGGLDQFHDDPRTIVLVDHVQDGDEAGVGQSTRHPRFPSGALQQRFPLGTAHVRRDPQFLDGHLALDHQIDGTPNGADTAPGDLRHQLVTALEQTLPRTVGAVGPFGIDVRFRARCGGRRIRPPHVGVF